MCWGPGRRHHWVSYGMSLTLEDARDEVMHKQFRYADGDGSLQLTRGLVDNGFRPDSAVEDFCIECVQQGVQIWTCEGSEQKLQSDYYQQAKGKNTNRPGLIYFLVDTSRTQRWIERSLHEHRHDSPGRMSVFAADAPDHQYFCEQLLNEKETVKNRRSSWDRVNKDLPNDLRDIARYNYVAMLIETHGGPVPQRGQVAEKKKAVVSKGVGRASARSDW